MDIPALYTRMILAIGDGTGASDSLLHVHAGLVILFLARIFTRRSLATPVPFILVCVAAVANEVMDRLSYGSWRVGDSLLDLVNTLFWPLALMIGLRLRRAYEIGPAGETSI
jgi:lipoprotein signal peptidase